MFPRSLLAAALALALGASAVGVLACGGNHGAAQGPGAKSPERQAEAEYDVARDAFEKGQPRIALDHVLKAVEIDDDNPRILYFASVLYLFFCSTETGMKSPDCRVADAEKFARLALKADDSFRDARNGLGQILILEGKYKEAIEVLQPLTKDPAYTETHLAWGNLGWAQVLSGALDDGIVSLNNAVTQPRFCVGHYRLGVAHEKKGELAEAESSFTNALAVDRPECKNLQDAWEGRGRVRLKLGKAADARADFQKCREISEATVTGKSCAERLTGSPRKAGT